jgi:YD repeat-containing protein
MHASACGWGQALVNSTYNPVPVAPTAASLTQHAQVPVSLATGQPQVSVPLYTVQCGSLSLPLSLSYHSGGIKVSEHASWVGLGWSLNAGGVITRSIRGKRDNGEFGTYFGAYQQNYPNPAIAQDYQLLERLANGEQIDGIPDLFSFNFMGHSGSFVNTPGAIAMLPPQPLQIVRLTEARCEMADENGNYYVFADVERTDHGHNSSLTLSDVTSWYLTQVMSRSREDTIFFDYQDYDHVVPTIEEESFAINRTGVNYSPRPDSHVTTRQTSNSSAFPIHGKYLTSIRCATAYVYFHSSLSRTDLPDERRLDSLSVSTQGFTRSFLFAYVPPASPGSVERLKLATVTERAPVNQHLQPMVHRFRYNRLKLPASTLSKAQDHWGYYNGKNNLSLLPTIPVPTPLDPAIPILPNAGDRNPDPDFAQADLLTRITYPSGGYSAFAFEGHDYGDTPVVRTEDVLLAHAMVNGQSPTPPNNSTPTVITTFTVAMEQDVNLSYYSQVALVNGSRYPIQIFACDDEGTCSLTQQWRIFVYYAVVSTQMAGGSSTNPKSTLLHLGPGTYKIMLMSADGKEAAITIRGQRPIGQPHLPYVGGVRLRADTLHDGLSHAQDIIQTYSYRDAANPAASSAGVSSWPNYGPFPVLAVYGMEGGGVYIPNENDSGMPLTGANTFPLYNDMFTASSQSSLGGGCPIYYAHVTVTRTSGAGGSSHYYYKGPDTSPDAPHNFPYVPDNVGSRTQPQLMQQVDLSASGDTVRRVVDYYQKLDPLTQTFVGYVYQPTPKCDAYQYRYPEPSCPRVYERRECRTISQFEYLAERREYQYAQGGAYRQPNLVTTRYFYDNLQHLQPTRVQKIFGPNDTLTTLTRYPLDYTTNTTNLDEATAGLKALQWAHCITTPIEQLQWRSKATNRWLVGGVLHQYKALPLYYRRPVSLQNPPMPLAGIPVASQDFTLSLAAPVPFTPAVLSSVRNGSTFQYAAAYRPDLRYEQYDRHYNPSLVRPAGDVPTTYGWGALASQPLVVVKNATPNNCAYTSFEVDSPSGWAYEPVGDNSTHYVVGGRTGTLAYRLDGTWSVSRDSLPQGDYELLFWAQATQRPGVTVTAGSILREEVTARAPNGWQQFRLRLRLGLLGAVELEATATPVLIDELRLHPVGAQMSSYTYDPSVGMTSQTDATGRTTTYEYDALGRLLRTRDEQGRIRTQNEYHYARP